MAEVPKTKIELYAAEYEKYLFGLFQRAGNTNGFEYLCTLLRVHGITDGHWDAFVEAEDTANDISDLLRKTDTEKEQKRGVRLGLFLYCHLTEMSVPYEILMNIFRCIKGERYHLAPFHRLIRNFGDHKVPPSPSAKIVELEKYANLIKEEHLIKIIKTFFNKDIRNAFYHSDYTITDEEFRIIEGGQYISAYDGEMLSELLASCFGFYTAFFSVYNSLKRGLSRGKQYYRWPNYEVLEILKDNDNLLGFKLHFPNGNHAFFTRKPYQGTQAINIMFEDGGLTYHVGDLDSYRKAENWFVDGKSFIETNTRYNPYGYWRPIIFSRNSDNITQKATLATHDRNIQSCLFYVLATGHLAIEFVVKSKTVLFIDGKYIENDGNGDSIVEIIECESNDKDWHLYDCSIFVKDSTTDSLSIGLNKFEELKAKFLKLDKDLNCNLKYKLYSSTKPKTSEGGYFTVSFSMDDPRTTLVASTLNVFPKSDWRIKSEWIEND